jgi:nucleotide-binding universal stress UspA family protein
MAKKFLLALDRSSNSLRAVEFVAKNISPTAEITLMSVVADPAAACELHGPSEVHPLLTENIKEFCVIEEAQRSAAEGFLDEAKKTLVRAGFSPDNICVELRRQVAGVAEDILFEANEGSYDGVILGKRGVSASKHFAFGSVSNKVINHAGKLSVIVVD